MEFYLKQRIFSWSDRFTVYDGSGADRYYVEGELFSWGKKLHLTDLGGRELAYIEQKLFTLLPRYRIYQGEQEIAEVIKEFSFFRREYTVEGLGWTVKGDFFDHEYEIRDGEQTVVSVSKEWFTWGDAYKISVDASVDPTLALSVVLVIDACLDAKD